MLALCAQLRAVAAAISSMIVSYRGAGDGGDNSPLYTLSPDDEHAPSHASAEGLSARPHAGLHQASEGRQGTLGQAPAAAAEPNLL